MRLLSSALLLACFLLGAGGMSAGAPGATTATPPTHASSPTAAATPHASSPAAGATPRASLPTTGAVPRASLPTIERQVMCVTCKIPLNVAESPQAGRERALIRGLIAEGHSEAQIKRVLIAEYGPAVLAMPSAKGFDLAAYLVPAAVVAAMAALLAVLLPGWRRRARLARERTGGTPALSAGDEARLDADLERFD